MLKLLKIEYLKAKSHIAFWTISALIIVFFFITTIAAGNLKFKFSIMYESAGVDFANFFKMPYIWNTFTWIASFFTHLWVFLIIILTGNEITFKTFKQQLIFGYDRNKIFLSKILVILTLGIVMILLTTTITLIFGFINTEHLKFADILKNSQYIIAYYIQTIAYMSIGLLLIFLIKNTGLSILAYIGLFIAGGMVRAGLKYFDLEKIIYFLPLKSISMLTPRPSINIAMTESLTQQTGFVDAPNVFSLTTSILIVSVYLAVFWYLTYLTVKKTNFK